MKKKYQVDAVYSANTKKDGTPLVGKDGKPFTKYSVLVGEDWLELKGWGKEDVKKGDIIEAEYQEKQGEGKWSEMVFKSLYLPKPDPTEKINELTERIEELAARVAVLEMSEFAETKSDIPPEIDDEDIPF